jgi:hypothetical protein
MEIILQVLMPAIIISISIVIFKFKCPNFTVAVQSISFSYLLKLVFILALSVSSTVAIDFIYCHILQTQCDPLASDPLNSVGYFFHSSLVFISSFLLEFTFSACLINYQKVAANKRFNQDK